MTLQWAHLYHLYLINIRERGTLSDSNKTSKALIVGCCSFVTMYYSAIN